MTQDKNNDITAISYNHLNLPVQITFTGNRKIDFMYDATGRKLCQKPSTNGTVDNAATRNYIAGFEYNGSNALQHIATAEGRYVMGAGYEYFLKDHLGNVRVALNASGVQTQSTMYYPFGLEINQNAPTATENKYKFNGIEKVNDFGANLNLAFYRSFDAAIGRWGANRPET